MSKIYYEMDEKTGEFHQIEDSIVVLQEGDIVRRKKQLEYCAQKYGPQKENGDFVWLVFRYGENLFPNISAANLTRLIYAATFCDNEGRLMHTSKLKEKMKLNRARWTEFWKEMTENNILYEQDDIVYVNSEFIAKGPIESDANYTRLFCEYVRQLYEGCNSHKELSYIFKVIPFINRRTNIVCRNQTEQDEKKIRAMRLGEFCDVIGYDKSNARRLSKELLKIRINGELPIGFFVSDLDEKTWLMVANPKLYFGGKYDDLFYKYRELFIQEAQDYKKLEGE